MFDIQNYTGFIAAVVAFQILPGPGTLTILNATARHGVRSGMGAVLGTLTGDLLFMLSATLGLAAALASRPVILSSLQWIGIVYLCWLGLKLLCAPVADNKVKELREENHWASFRLAFAVCLTNPKAIVFFLAFFPLFLSPESSPFTLVVLMAHVSIISLLYQTVLVLIGHAVATRLLRYKRASIWTNRIVGLGLLGFGVKLAINRK